MTPVRWGTTLNQYDQLRVAHAYTVDDATTRPVCGGPRPKRRMGLLAGPGSSPACKRCMAALGRAKYFERFK